MQHRLWAGPPRNSSVPAAVGLIVRLRYSLCSSCSCGAQPPVGEASHPFTIGGWVNDSGSQLTSDFRTSNRPAEYPVKVGISRLSPFLHPHPVEMQESATAPALPAFARFGEYAGSGAIGGYGVSRPITWPARQVGRRSGIFSPRRRSGLPPLNVSQRHLYRTGHGVVNRHPTSTSHNAQRSGETQISLVRWEKMSPVLDASIWTRHMVGG